MEPSINRHRLKQFIRDNGWSGEQVRELLDRAGFRPSVENWRAMLRILTLIFGATLFLVGVVFFFAYN